MKREEIENLREAVRCAVLLEQAGFGVVGWMGRAGTRVPEWRGFSTGGSKVLFRLGAPDALRLCVTEAAIDAMSLAAIEGLQDATLYVSTGGGWSPRTEVGADHPSRSPERAACLRHRCQRSRRSSRFSSAGQTKPGGKMGGWSLGLIS